MTDYGDDTHGIHYEYHITWRGTTKLCTILFIGICLILSGLGVMIGTSNEESIIGPMFATILAVAGAVIIALMPCIRRTRWIENDFESLDSFESYWYQTEYFRIDNCCCCTLI